jgi:hypothetical protein
VLEELSPKPRRSSISMPFFGCSGSFTFSFFFSLPFAFGFSSFFGCSSSTSFSFFFVFFVGLAGDFSSFLFSDLFYSFVGYASSSSFFFSSSFLTVGVAVVVLL